MHLDEATKAEAYRAIETACSAAWGVKLGEPA